MLNQASSPDQKAQVFALPDHLPNPFRDLGEPVKSYTSAEVGPESDMAQFMLKQRRCDYFNTQSHLMSMLIKLSDALTAIAEKQERKTSMESYLQLLNRWLLDRRVYMALNNEGPLSLLGIHVPMLRQRDTRHQVLRVHVDMCRIFSSATRAPYMLVYETANLDEQVTSSADDLTEGVTEDTSSNDMVFLPRDVLDALSTCIAQELGAAGSSAEAPREQVWRLLAQQTPESWLQLRIEEPTLTPATARASTPCVGSQQTAAGKEVDIEVPANKDPPATSQGPTVLGAPSDAADNVPLEAIAAAPSGSSPAEKRHQQARDARQLIWGDSWKDRCERARQASPYGRYRSWNLNAMVVKGADDLRQELLAAQVVKQFISIFAEAGLPLWLKEIEILVNSSSSGIIEYIYDSVSVDSMKKNCPGKSLAEIFKVAFADKMFEAKQNFIESCAAYSLVVYFLQVKDRHNGNLMLDSTGHICHIDFGFMLSNSPGGNMAFEQSPFKLTQEFLDVMDGECSDQYEYFRTLVIRGFLEARKHMERIILPVRMMLVGSKMPCFREGSDWVLQTLHDRFFVNLTEEACIERIVDLIDSSVNNWRTIQYDNYQRIMHGII